MASKAKLKASLDLPTVRVWWGYRFRKRHWFKFKGTHFWICPWFWYSLIWSYCKSRTIHDLSSLDFHGFPNFHFCISESGSHLAPCQAVWAKALKGLGTRRWYLLLGGSIFHHRCVYIWHNKTWKQETRSASNLRVHLNQLDASWMPLCSSPACQQQSQYSTATVVYHLDRTGWKTWKVHRFMFEIGQNLLPIRDSLHHFSIDLLRGVAVWLQPLLWILVSKSSHMCFFDKKEMYLIWGKVLWSHGLKDTLLEQSKALKLIGHSMAEPCKLLWAASL